MSERALHNVKTEQQVLGAVLFKQNVYFDVMEVIAAEDFYDERHGIIWKTIVAIVASGKRVNAEAILDFVRHEKGPKITEEYIDLLSDAFVTPEEAIGAAKHLSDLGKRRRFREACRTAIKEVEILDPRADPTAAITAAESEILNATRVDNTAIRKMSEWGMAVFNRLAAVHEGSRGRIGLEWGLTAIDNTCGPALPGKLIIISGRPGEGKSAFVQQAGVHFAKQTPTVAFSIEMDGTEWGERDLSQRSLIGAWRLSRGRIQQADLEKLGDYVWSDELRKLPYYVEETPRITLDQIWTKAIRYKHQLGMGALLIDHLHIIAKRDRRQDPADAVEEHARGLKELAKKLSIPVIALAQMNSVIRDRENWRPTSRDLMYFSSIERHADVIAFVHRPEVAHADRKPDATKDEGRALAKWEGIAEILRGKAEIIQTKLRGGKGNQHQEARFVGEIMRFEDVEAKVTKLDPEEELAF